METPATYGHGPVDYIERISDAACYLVTALQEEYDAQLSLDDTVESVVNSIIGSDNPMTGKPHSATSAKEAAKATPQVRDAEKKKLDAQLVVTLARATYEKAKLRAKLAVGLAVAQAEVTV